MTNLDTNSDNAQGGGIFEDLLRSVTASKEKAFAGVPGDWLQAASQERDGPGAPPADLGGLPSSDLVQSTVAPPAAAPSDNPPTTGSTTRASKRLLSRGSSLVIAPSTDATAAPKTAKAAARPATRPSIMLPPAKSNTVGGTPPEPATPQDTPGFEDPDTPAKRRRKSTHTCQGDAAVSELAALKDEVATLRASIVEVASGLQGARTTQKDHRFLITDLKDHVAPLLKVGSQLKALEVANRDTQAAVEEVSTANDQVRESLVTEVRPILMSFGAFMNEARPVLDALNTFMKEARPRIDHLVGDYKKLEDSVTEASSRLGDLEGAVAVATASAKRPRLSLAPLLLPPTQPATTTPYSSGPAPASYPMSMTTTPMNVQSAAQTAWGGTLPTQTPATQGQSAPTVVAPQGGQGGGRGAWGILIGPVNFNGASAKDVLRALFAPIQGGSVVTRVLRDPVLAGNMDHIFAKAPSKEEAYEIASLWRERRSHQHAGIITVATRQGN